MKSQFVGILAAAIFAGLMVSSLPAEAQQKTATACRDEWRANKAAMQANKITQKAYIAQCTSGVAAAPPAAAPAPAIAPSVAQSAPGQKTATACRDEWRANKAAMQANKITQKAYIAQCASGVAAAPPVAAPAPTPAIAPSVTQSAPGQKTATACRDEWRANKAAMQANKITQKAYIAQCTSGVAAAPVSATPGQASAPAPAPAVPTPSSPPVVTARPAPPIAPVVPSRPSVTGAPTEYATESQAKAQCGGDLVVWANLRSRIYHFSGFRNYGTTENGAYMCERDAISHSFRAAKNEQHP